MTTDQFFERLRPIATELLKQENTAEQNAIFTVVAALMGCNESPNGPRDPEQRKLMLTILAISTAPMVDVFLNNVLQNES